MDIFTIVCLMDLLVVYNVYCFYCRARQLGFLYLGSLVVLLVYSILYGLTAKEARWLGSVTSAAVIVLGNASVWNTYSRYFLYQFFNKIYVAMLFMIVILTL